MAYIGNSPANTGNYQIVDDISSSFNGSLTSFALTAGSVAITPAKSGQLLVGVNGVLQEPDDSGTNGFKVSGSNIVFSAAPESGDTFWSVYQGQNVDIGTPSDDVVDTVHIKDNAITAAKIAAGTIVASDIADNSITNAKMADDAIDSSEIADGAIDTAHIGANQVTAAKVAADVATQAELDTVSTVASAALPKAGGTMTGNLIASGASTPKLTVKSNDGTSASLKLQRVNENDASTDFEIKNDGGTFKIIGDNSSQNEYESIRLSTTEARIYTGNTERMRIDSSGNVGIGVTPSTLTHIKASSGAILRVEETGGSYGELEAGGSGFHINAKSGGYITLRPNGNTEAMRIDSSGRVGIGTSSPTSELDVTGLMQTTRSGTGLTVRGTGTGSSDYSGIGFKLQDTSSDWWSSGAINVTKEQSWTSTSSTRDSK